ncbi:MULTISPECIES: branched-chain amino acid ABC transporter permease [Geobacter]|uniref:Branched-chain amino acid ABC transporter permease n=2 Tax=Geobacter TaxID=28231 RepID=A0A0C1TTQ4_9BACT|nr:MULTISPECIES: branched-chain amino acid ABC transporter permease [Geobacter]KIE44159.1 branched-chain amino acid ABC transporter permease [Geobacter soli]MBE2888932.1 branched-chain amino acid ABC transporter permease [Geobacter anodireducens]HMN03724.1 branched-chain amino acid ABC transporter permease [Geobacter anodireducens]
MHVLSLAKLQSARFIAFSLLIMALPVLISEGYLLNVFVFVGIHTMLAVALNLLLGYAGQISLGQAAFFGLGAYASGILTATYGWNPWLAMVAVAGAVGILAFAIGFPILKLKGHYLAMATLGFGIIVYIIFNEAVELTGGPSGFPGIPNLEVGSVTFDSDLKNYYLIWGIALVTILLSVNLVNSRIGRGLRAIHDSEVAARVMGVNVRLLKVQVFALSAVISSVAGSLYAHTMTFVSPTSFGFNFSVELVTMVIIGGLGSIYGSFLGATLLTLLPELLRAFQDYDIVVYGLLLIFMTMFMPGGLVRGIPDLLHRFRSRVDKGTADA